MAPMTRSNGSLTPARPDLPAPRTRDVSWQFVPTGAGSTREDSAEPPSSYDEAEMREDYDVEEEDDQLSENPEDNEDILHPLRETANRVGREVELFAEALDQYNPLKASDKSDQYEMTLELIDTYHEIAVRTSDRLRQQHDSVSRKDIGRAWRSKMKGLPINLDEDEMDLEDEPSEFINLKTTVEDKNRWEEEAQTWDLLRQLVHLRFSHPEDGAASQPTPVHRYSTEREIWDNFLETDGLALERKTVLDWLKNTAEDTRDDISEIVQDLQKKADRGDIVGQGWIYTKNAIKQTKRLHTWPRELDQSSLDIQRAHSDSTGIRPLIMHLDPDAPTRQSRNLEAADEYFERAIWRGCYEMLRRGTNPEEVREWLVDRTEVWRAVSMSGFPDERLDDEEGTGNPASTALWKRMCFALARNGTKDKYECAVYGILSGDIDSVLPVCENWDDFVFVHYNALLRTQFDLYLQNVFGSQAPAFEVFDAIQYHGDPSTAGASLVDKLKTHPNTKEETLKPLKMLQGVLIANKFADFIYDQGLAHAKLANRETQSVLIPPSDEVPREAMDRYIALDDHDSLRVVAHMLLIFMSLGLDLGGPRVQPVVQNVIVAYVSFLRLAAKEELIPLYCAQLSGNRRYATLSRSLIDVTDNEQRRTQLELIRKLGLDVQQFVRFQSRFLFADNPDPTSGYFATGKFDILEDDPKRVGQRKVKADFLGDEDDVDIVDSLLIRSLEWYLLVDGLWRETFQLGTMLYMRFFRNMHLNAARMLAVKVRSDVIAEMKTGKIIGRSLNFQGLEAESEDEDLTEVIGDQDNCKSLLQKQLVAEAKNYRELETFIEFLDVLENTTCTFEIFRDQAMTERDHRNVRRKLAEFIQSLKDWAPVLLTGWLLTGQQERSEEQFRLLREAYLPETILAYIISLQLSGDALSRELILDCMDIAALIAVDGSDLQELFIRSGRMKELVACFAQAGQELLIVNSQKSSHTKSKKQRKTGRTPDLWTVEV